jgi:hypothetical protein
MSATVFAAWVILAVTSGEPEAKAGQGSDPISALLELPAPAPPWEGKVNPPRNDAAPADDTPLDLLLRYWSRQPEKERPRLTDRARSRLLEGCEKEPQHLPHLLPFFPDTPDTVERVKKLYDRVQLVAKPGSNWTESVRFWLMTHSNYFRDELIQAARASRFRLGSLDGKREILALVKLDWAQAETVLEEHAAGDEPRRAAEARSTLLQHTLQTKDVEKAALLRKQLQAVVADKKQPPHARAVACQGLLRLDWPGRDEWYLSLFADETMRWMVEESHVLTPLQEPVESNPDKWIPVIAKLVGNKDRAVHDTAVSCLIPFHLEKARKDALRPLLPWLSDPDWSSARDRLRLIQSLDRVDLPESVPGLIEVVEREADHALAGAAQALAVYRDRRAILALKKALARDNPEHHRRSLVVALLATDGLTVEEVVAAIEAYAVQTSTPEGLAEVREAVFDVLQKKRLSATVSLGYHLSYLRPSQDEAAARLLQRADAAEKEKPEVARAIRGTVQDWPGKSVDSYILGRISAGKADADTLRAALVRRKSLRANVPDELRALRDKPGATRGWAAILSGEAGQQARVLEGDDREAQRALLAGARLLRESLPVEKVGRLLTKGAKKLALAAERYLESEDSPAARQLVYDQHPGEALILGARQDFDPGHDSYEAFDEWEKRLRDEVRGKDGPEEIYALLSAGYWGNAGQVVIRIRPDKAELSIHAGAKQPKVRTLAPDELKGLRSFVSDNRIDDLPPLNIIVFDGIQYEYLHLTKKGGRRVFMNNPDVAGDSVYGRLTGYLTDVGRKESTQQKGDNR